VRRSTIPVVLLAVISFIGGLGRGAIADTDEAFYAESAREMVESGDWLTPRFNYEPRFQKPALYYWVTAALFAVGGPQEFSARLFAALSGVGLVLITTACGRRWCAPNTAISTFTVSPARATGLRCPIGCRMPRRHITGYPRPFRID
jgi:4-amino-4-deoxy-L-arabinose transferase-like glycosyltransferase